MLPDLLASIVPVLSIHALVSRAEGHDLLPESSCDAALQRSGVSPRNLWKTCCDPVRHDGFGSTMCFTRQGLQGWQARLCCSSLEQHNLTQQLWNRALFVNEVQNLKPTSGNMSNFMFVAYHKTGATLSYCLATTHAIRRLLLGTSTGSGSIGWVRSLSSDTNPTYQRGIFLQNASQRPHRLLSYWISPMEMNHQEIFSNYLVPGVGRVVHLVRKPSEVIVSAYLYHMRSNEVWHRLTDPPNCDTCDHIAWKRIFSSSNFNRSYEKVLRSSSMEKGIEIETLRSRWEILKMMYNMKIWQGRSDVLSISLSHFSNDFDATLRCILSFWLDGLKPARVLRPKALKTLLAQAHVAGKRSKKWYRANPKKVSQATDHIQRLSRQPDYRFIWYADDLYEQLMLQENVLYRRFGCPEWRKAENNARRCLLRFLNLANALLQI